MKFKCCLPLRCPSCRGSLPMYLLFTTCSSKKIHVCRHCQVKYRFADLCNVMENTVISLVFFAMLVAMLAGVLRLQWLIYATFDQQEIADVLALVYILAVPAVIMCSYAGIAVVFTNKLERWVPTCQKCGYNLRGLSGNHCPECGKSFDRSNPAFTGDRKPSRIERLVDWIVREGARRLS